MEKFYAIFDNDGSISHIWSEMENDVGGRPLDVSSMHEITEEQYANYKCLSLQDGQVVFDNEAHKIKLKADINQETYNLIKNWCQANSLGCEEAYLSKGIEDAEDESFLAYKVAKEYIKAAQKAKKDALDN